MNTTYKIRKAEPKDILKLVELSADHAAYEKATYRSLGKAPLLEHHLFSEQPSFYCLVAEINGEVVGYTAYMKQFSMWDCASYIYMDCLYLDEDARGFGLGEKLVLQIKEHAKELGCTLLQWQTPSFNTRAIKFYKRLGASSKSKERFYLSI